MIKGEICRFLKLSGSVRTSTLPKEVPLLLYGKSGLYFYDGNKELLMGKKIKLTGILLLLFFSSSHAIASERYGYGHGFGHGYIAMSSEKFVTGIANAATGFLELPKNIILTTQQETIIHGMTIGLVSGVMHTVGRTVIGVFDVATFLIPTPPSIQPPFIWQDFSVESSY